MKEKVLDITELWLFIDEHKMKERRHICRYCKRKRYQKFMKSHIPNDFYATWWCATSKGCARPKWFKE